jgi:TonB-dependent starch-binding outer membrane protein SusC
MVMNLDCLIDSATVSFTQTTKSMQLAERLQAKPRAKTNFLFRIFHSFLFLLVFFSPGVRAETMAQGISLDEKNETLANIFRKVSAQSGYLFFYSDDILSKASRVSINVSDESIERVLELCFRGQPLEYEIINKTVVVKLRSPRRVVVAIADSLPTLRGNVRGPDGPIPAASVTVKGSRKGTVTDAQGNFELAEVDASSVIRITSVGYEDREEALNGRVYIEATLTIVADALDETMLIAYGTTTRRKSTGTVSKVSSKEIEKQPVLDPILALQGRVPGLSITQSSGVPGSGLTVRLRGQNSIANGNDPFYIVDGVPFGNNNNLPARPIFNQPSPFHFLNPSDIESIEVLRDADATAIYGSRGANGVILITTKKGVRGSPKLEVNLAYGIGWIAKKADVLGTADYRNMRYQAFQNDGEEPNQFSAPDLLLWDSVGSKDWQSVVAGKKAKQTTASVTFSGGNDFIQYHASATSQRETLVFSDDFYDRKNSLRLNVTGNSRNKRLTSTFTIGFTADKNNFPQTDLSQLALTLPPNAPEPFTPEGELNWQDGFDNPFAYHKRTSEATSRNLTANANVLYEVVKGLSATLNAGYNLLFGEAQNITPVSSFNPAWGVQSGVMDRSTSEQQTWIVEPQLQFVVGHKQSKISLQAGATLQESKSHSDLLFATGFPFDDALGNIQAAAQIFVFRDQFNTYNYLGFFGRVNYEFNNRYVFNLTGRRDGSSRFGPGKKFSNFGSAAFAWIFSEEPFMKGVGKSLSFGKLRASFGTSGNDQIPDYGFLNLYQSELIKYAGISGLAPFNLFNENYSWETNRKFEVSAELGFFNNRVLTTINYFKNRSSNQLIGYALPSQTGFSSVQANLPAVVENQGFEFENSLVIRQTRNVTWRINFNLTVPMNKLIEFPGMELSSYQNLFVVGESIFRNLRLRSAGVDPTTGLYRFEDADKDGVETEFPEDYLPATAASQQYFGGLGSSLTLKGFEFSFLFQFVKQTGFAAHFPFGQPGTLGNQPTFVLNAWKTEGDNADVQKFSQGAASGSYFQHRFSSAQFEDASFIRLKTLQVAYTFPSESFFRRRVSALQLYVSGQNLLTITRYKGFDPENQLSLPPLTMITGGIRCTF